jgi:hypothetical protein
MEPRPTQRDESVLEDFYQNMAEALAKDSDMAAGMSLERIVEGLRYSGHPAFDGFEYAKQLERSGWDEISAQDIETLDCADSFMREAIEKAEAAWVEQNQIKPPFESGTVVRAKIARILPGAKRVEECVTEGRVYLDDRNKTTGHCLFRDHQWAETRGEQGGYVLRWEDVEVI